MTGKEIPGGEAATACHLDLSACQTGGVITVKIDIPYYHPPMQKMGLCAAVVVLSLPFASEAQAPPATPPAAPATAHTAAPAADPSGMSRLSSSARRPPTVCVPMAPASATCMSFCASSQRRRAAVRSADLRLRLSHRDAGHQICARAQELTAPPWRRRFPTPSTCLPKSAAKRRSTAISRRSTFRCARLLATSWSTKSTRPSTSRKLPGSSGEPYHFTAPGTVVVLAETLTLQVPADKYVQVWSPNHKPMTAEHDGLKTYTWNVRAA